MSLTTQIIIEGVDGTGKTTLANLLKEKLAGYDVLHCTQHDPKDYNFYSETMRKEFCIFDRHFVGEQVYGIVDRGESKISIEELKKLSVQSSLQRVIIIYCTRSLENIFQTLEERTDTRYLSKKDRIRIYALQKRFAEVFDEVVKFNRKIFVYNFDIMNTEKFVNTIIKEIKEN